MSTRARFSFLLAALALAACGAPPAARNVVLVSLDTTRADHLSLYGYERPTTPFLDRFFAGGAVFDHALTPFNTTVPAHTTLLTGVYPHTHGNRRGGGFPRRYRTLAEILAERGFRTGGFISAYPLKPRLSSLDRGFEVYSARFRESRRDAARTVDEALAWLGGLDRDDRFFLFVHLFDSHGPYGAGDRLAEFRSPDPGRRLRFVPKYQRQSDEHGRRLSGLDQFVDRYDAQIRHQDDQLARLLAAIDVERTLVVLTADHGETLGDRPPAWNLDHGHNLFQEQIAVALAFRGPRVRPGRRAAVAESVDLVPTILDLLDLEVHTGPWEGSSLAASLRDGEDRASDGLGFASSDPAVELFATVGYRLRPEGSIQTVVSRRWKLIRYPGVEDDYLELYRLDRDPGERRNLAAEEPRVVARMLAVLDAWSRGAPRPDARPEDAARDLDALRALGYVE